mgnify:CR=1 FL=1
MTTIECNTYEHTNGQIFTYLCPSVVGSRQSAKPLLTGRVPLKTKSEKILPNNVFMDLMIFACSPYSKSYRGLVNCYFFLLAINAWGMKKKAGWELYLRIMYGTQAKTKIVVISKERFKRIQIFPGMKFSSR